MPAGFWMEPTVNYGTFVWFCDDALSWATLEVKQAEFALESSAMLNCEGILHISATWQSTRIENLNNYTFIGIKT